jgi:hypothetical protein
MSLFLRATEVLGQKSAEMRFLTDVIAGRYPGYNNVYERKSSVVDSYIHLKAN